MSPTSYQTAPPRIHALVKVPPQLEVDDLREAERLFVHDLTGTLLTVAKDFKLQVEFNPYHVKGYRLIGYENRLLGPREAADSLAFASMHGYPAYAAWGRHPADDGVPAFLGLLTRWLSGQEVLFAEFGASTRRGEEDDADRLGLLAEDEAATYTGKYGYPITADVAAHAGAAAIIAWGSCASNGCIQSAKPNPTNATPIHEIVNRLVINDGILGDILGKNTYKSDHIHPNKLGYQMLADSISELLRASGAVSVGAISGGAIQ